MKQGQASLNGTYDTKVEPKSRTVSPEAVANIGRQQVTYKKITLYQGRGYKAPIVGEDQHESGSQGRY